MSKCRPTAGEDIENGADLQGDKTTAVGWENLLVSLMTSHYRLDVFDLTDQKLRNSNRTLFSKHATELAWHDDVC